MNLIAKIEQQVRMAIQAEEDRHILEILDGIARQVPDWVGEDEIEDWWLVVGIMDR